MTMTHEEVTANLARYIANSGKTETKTCNTCKLPRPLSELRANKNGVQECIKCKQQNAPKTSKTTHDKQRDLETATWLKSVSCDLGDYEL